MKLGLPFMSPEARRPMRRGVPWLGAFFIAAIVGMAVYDIVRGYRAAVDETGRELDTQARIMAEQTARSLQAIDVVLRHLDEQFRQGALDAMSAPELHAYLREQAIGLVQIKGLVMINADGSPRASSFLFPMPAGISVANYSVFQNVRGARGAHLVVADATLGLDNVWIVPIVRRLEAANGSFAGAVAARVRVDYFQDFYRDVHLGAGTNVTLTHRNGTLVARYPAAPGSIGKRFSVFDDLLAAYDAGRREPIRALSPIDGVERFASLQAVPEYPLMVFVTRDTTVALAAWRQQAIGSAARTLALAGLAVVLLTLTLRQLARLDTARVSLETAQERFALAVHGSDDGIWDWDQASARMFASARAREILGMPPGPESQPADEWFAAVRAHPDDEARRWSALDAHLAGRTPAYEEEFRVLHPDGVYRWVGVRGVCVRDAAGKPHRMAGSVTDVDVRRRAEEARRESEERFTLAVAGSKDGIVDWDIVRDRMFTSPRAMHIVGIASDVTMRTRAEWTALLRLHPDDMQRHADDMQRHLQGLTDVREGEYRICHPDGAYRWVRVRGTSVRDADGRAIRWAGSVSDIDAQKRIEHALRQSEERYQLAVAGSNEGLWDWDLRSDELFMSARAQGLLGMQPGEPLRARRAWIDARSYHPDDLWRLRKALSSHLRGRTPHFSCEFRMRHESGEWHWYRQRGIAVRDTSGRPYRLAGSMEDVTDRHVAEAQRDTLEGQLRQAQKLEAIGTLAGGIAHDFNNILSAILGYGEMAQREAVDGSAQRRHIDAAMSAAMRAKSLVERILAFSRSGVGDRVPVHVQSVVEEAVSLMEASLAPGITLESRLDAGDAALMGDPTQIHQVVMNLCANAAQAIGSAHGTIAVALETSVEAEPLVLLTATLPAGRYLRLSVRDSGVGIAPQILERIFDPFFTTKEVGVGTGLGLSLVHGIVGDLGGGIDVESRLGAGARLTVVLPWQHSMTRAPARDAPVPTGSGETVLLVDDEEALVRLGEEMMAELGYEAVGFTSGLAALQSFEATPERFHLVVSDEAMPELTGSELARAIRRLRPDIPIVLMSGYVTPALSARARDVGVRDVLAKPLVRGEIARSLAGALANR
jgi:PAS domain S-box-containing protein